MSDGNPYREIQNEKKGTVCVQWIETDAQLEVLPDPFVGERKTP